MKKFLLAFLIAVILVIIFYSQRNQFSLSMSECEDISSSRLKIVCYSLFTRNYSYCELAQDFSNYCYDSVFPLIEVNQNLCLSLPKNYQKISCLLALSIKTKNPDVCSLLEDETLSSICYAELMNYVDYFTDSFCYNISHESTRFICLAEKNKDLGYCYNITQEIEERAGCLGILTKNVSYCKIETSGMISKITLYYCIKNIALSLNDISICDEIYEDEGKWECIAALAENDDICDKAPDPWKDFCRLEFIKNQLTKKYLWKY